MLDDVYISNLTWPTNCEAVYCTFPLTFFFYIGISRISNLGIEYSGHERSVHLTHGPRIVASGKGES